MITSLGERDSSKVLVVDDELIVRELLSRMLSAKGCAVDAAANGEEGLARAEEDRYDVVITDIKMPKMDGFTFMEQLKTLDPEIPVIIVTAVGDVQNAVKAVRLGAYDFIHKPFGPGAELWRTVGRAIELSRARIENREYHRRLEEINKRLTHELEMARHVQENYAAKSLVPDERLDMVGLYEPCFNVGGDLYGAFPIGEQKVAFYIADVSGHGPSAALITGMIKVNLDSMAGRKELHGLISTPHDLIAQLDLTLTKSLGSGMFTTMLYSVLDCETGKLTYCNAGHCQPILLKADTGAGIILDESRNFALALAPGFDHEYQSHTVDFSAGDLLVLYTDGIVEASGPDEDRFGTDRLVEVVAASSRASAQELVQAISRALQGFTGGVPPHDDVALLVARRKG